MSHGIVMSGRLKLGAIAEQVDVVGNEYSGATAFIAHYSSTPAAFAAKAMWGVPELVDVLPSFFAVRFRGAFNEIRTRRAEGECPSADVRFRSMAAFVNR
jgi:hypothetical protein